MPHTNRTLDLFRKNGVRHKAKTAAYTVTNQDGESIFSNLGATASTTYTLPTSPPTGFKLGFKVQAAQNLILDPGASAAFYVNGAKQADAMTLHSFVIGDRVEIQWDGADWVVTSKIGRWGVPNGIYKFRDDFDRQAVLNTETDNMWILNSGADAQAVDPAINVAAGGEVRLTTGNADGAVANDGSQIVAAIPVNAALGGLWFETRLHINTAITDISVNAGFTDVTTLEEPFSISGTTITSVASDAACFVYDTAQTTDQWYACGVAGDTDATGNAITGTAPVADTDQTLRIEIDADGEGARFYLDGVLSGTLTANAVTAATSVYATVIANATTTTSKTVDIDYIEWGHLR